MTGRWRGSWAAAQITGVFVSSVLWLVFSAVWPMVGLAGVLLGVAYLWGRNTRVGLWWRFGACPAGPVEQRHVLVAIVPIHTLRGRRQPRVWLSPRIGQTVVMPTDHDLVVGEPLAAALTANRMLPDEFGASVSHALGQQPVRRSQLVAVVDAYSLPWTLVEITNQAMLPWLHRIPMLQFAWQVRWVVFGLALVDSARNDRWVAFAGVLVVSVLSWSTGFLRRRWLTTCARLGDDQCRADGLAEVLAGIRPVRSHIADDLKRTDRLAAGVSR